MSKKPLITKNETVLITDTITGAMETADVRVNVFVAKDQPKFRGEPYTMLFQKLGIVTAKNIQPVTAKLLLYLCACVEYGNVINKGAEQIAEELGYSKRNVYRALKELQDLKVIIRDKNATDKRMSLIYLNPYQSWKGKVSDRKKKIASFNPDQLEMFADEMNKQPLNLLPNNSFDNKKGQHSLLSSLKKLPLAERKLK